MPLRGQPRQLADVCPANAETPTAPAHRRPDARMTSATAVRRRIGAAGGGYAMGNPVVKNAVMLRVGAGIVQQAFQVMPYRQPGKGTDIGSAGIAAGQASGQMPQRGQNNPPQLADDFTPAALPYAVSEHQQMHTPVWQQKVLAEYVGTLKVPEFLLRIAGGTETSGLLQRILKGLRQLW